jgi:putative transposase
MSSARFVRVYCASCPGALAFTWPVCRYISLHIVQRGHNREACFFGEEDYLAYRYWLGEALKESGGALHTYMLMINPVHWLLTPAQPQDVPRLIISLGRRSVRYINKAYHRTGTLWDSRYQSSLVPEDTY